MKRLAMIGLVALGATTMACGKDSTGPSVTFPSLPSSLLSAFCVRGQGLVGETKSGSVTSGDCDAADIDPSDLSYYEVWRVRVASAVSVTFDANSSFDNYLLVLRLDSHTSTTASLTSVGENDDRAFGNLNALVTVTLQPNTDYFVSVSGYNYSATGPYTLQIR